MPPIPRMPIMPIIKLRMSQLSGSPQKYMIIRASIIIPIVDGMVPEHASHATHAHHSATTPAHAAAHATAHPAAHTAHPTTHAAAHPAHPTKLASPTLGNNPGW